MTIISSSTDRWGTKELQWLLANAASPMHQMLKQFMDASQFYLELYDHPNEMRQLCEDMEPFFDQIHRIWSIHPQRSFSMDPTSMI